MILPGPDTAEAMGRTVAGGPFPAAPVPPVRLRADPAPVVPESGRTFADATERHAFHRIAALPALPGGAVCVAFPWSALIDRLEAGAQGFDPDLAALCRRLPQEGERITICGHVRARHHADLFRQAGIRHVFWPHATRADVANPGDPRFHPFPFYPGAVPEALPEAAPEADALPRRHLFTVTAEDTAGGPVPDLPAADARGLIHPPVPDRIRDALRSSTFSICPSGSGSGAARIWDSLGAGAIPVILSRDWAPPGNSRLWDMAAVFCEGDPGAIRALPGRLAATAADPELLARMRHAMRQLWLLYGPQGFVTDVQALLLASAGASANANAGAGAAGSVPVSAPDAVFPMPDGPDSARRLLITWAGRLLLDPAAALGRMGAEPGLSAALDRARALATDAVAVAHLAAVLDHARARVAALTGCLPAPVPLRRAAPRVALFGRHARRTPLGYAPFRRLIGDRLDWVDDPARADLLVSGFSADWRENAGRLLPLLAGQGAPKLAVISEEPLWDVTWSGPFTGRDGRMSVEGTEIRYAFLGHETSAIFRFDRLPYFVLTDDGYPLRYANMMARFSGLGPAALLARWRNAPVSAAFFAERRQGASYEGGFPDRDVTRLSAYRSKVAELAQGPGLLRVGQGWGAAPRRQNLPDWHLDKLAQLDGRVRMVAAYENVHLRDYISEKIFDAFAVGGVPVYWAGPRHRIFELVPGTAMLNTQGLDPAAAAERIADFVPDAAFAAAWLDTCAALAALFGDFRQVTAERRRIADALVDEVLALV